MYILGGTFNPIHNGHLAMSRFLATELDVPCIFFMPNGDPPHKITTVSEQDRYTMARLATTGLDYADVLDAEIGLNETCYTYDTVKRLLEDTKDTEDTKDITYIIGSDNLKSLSTWKNFTELITMIDFVVLNRQDTDVLADIETLRQKFDINIREVSGFDFDLSSSNVRADIDEGLDISELVPKPVFDYIYDNNLYDYKYKRLYNIIYADIKQTLSPHRFNHSVSVVETSEHLASFHNVSIPKVRLASIMHDYAKEFSDDTMLEYIKKYDLPIDERATNNINLLHGIVASAILEHEYKVNDTDILNAVKNHTFGDVGMTDLQLIVAISDFVEPTRNFKEPLKSYASEIYDVAKQDLTKAYILKLKNVVRYNKSDDYKTIETLNFYLKKDTK